MVDHKWDISRLSPGEKNALKRNAGIMMDNASMQAIEAFYRALSRDCKKYSEEQWFAALCMQCLWREEDHPIVKPFPEMLRSIYQNPKATDSIRKRCVNYLDSIWSEDGFLLGKICNLVRMMRTSNPYIIPDFEALADDLTIWNNHNVQRIWLNTICRTQFDYEKKMEGKNNVD